jgi:hypothetical protein
MTRFAVLPSLSKRAAFIDWLADRSTIVLPLRNAFGLTYYNSDDGELLSTISAST